MLLNDVDTSSKSFEEKNKKIKTLQCYEKIIYRAKEYRDEEFKKEVEEKKKEYSLDSIDINDNNIIDNNIIIIKIPNKKIKLLQNYSIEKYGSKNYAEELFNEIINNDLKNIISKKQRQHQTTSLLFNNKEKIRKDVLRNLVRLAGDFKERPEYPILRPISVRLSINKVLDKPDPRTLAKYFLCVRNWVKKTHQIEPEYGINWNMSSFGKTVQTKWVESEYV